MRKKHLNFKLALLLAAVVLAAVQLFGGSAFAATTFEKITKGGVMNVGYSIYPPVAMKDPNTGKLSGHFIDAIEFIARQMKVKIEYHEVTWATFIAALQSGRIDISIANTFRTIPRALAVDFTTPIYYLGFDVLAKKNDDRFKLLEDLNKKGLKIAVTQGGANHEYAKRYMTNAELIPIPSADNTQVHVEVLSGRADVSIGGNWDVGLFVKKNPNEMKSLFPDKPFNMNGMAWAVRKGDQDWLNFLNIAIDYILVTGLEKEWELKYEAKHLRPKIIWE